MIGLFCVVAPHTWVLLIGLFCVIAPHTWVLLIGLFCVIVRRRNQVPGRFWVFAQINFNAISIKRANIYNNYYNALIVNVYHTISIPGSLLRKSSAYVGSFLPCSGLIGWFL